MTNHARTRRDLDFLTGYWPDLAEARIPGTSRYWTLNNRRAKHRGTHEFWTHLDALEPQPAPVHLDVLDTLAALTMWADTTSETITQQLGHERLPHATSAYADPRPHLRHIAANLEHLDPVDIDALADAARDHAGRAAHLLGIQPFVLTLDCRCPWCLTDRSLLVRQADDHWYITCTSGICEPPDTACGTWRHGRPCWPDWEFEWLATHIERAAS